ncbi:NAD(P)-dependent oxidoreductase [Mucilaginibacter angelicae]|uniref:NAD(P)-dependent oxidoreductase n=1 Tax=Mucilaginibacter angelicae TaxID=869718 RepID=A0ABV6L485_9SPHI
MKQEQALSSFHILILGGNGGIGKQCINEALANGHYVTAVLRTPSKLDLAHPNLKIVKGDVTDPLSFIEYVGHSNAVISAIGVSGGITGDKPTSLYSEGAVNILGAMQKVGVKRVFFISASALDVSPVLPLFARLLARYVIQKLLKYMYADLRIMETRVKESGLDWTIIRPPQLVDKPTTGNYRIALNTFLKNGLKISRADVAHFIIANIANEETYKATVEIAY